MCGLQNKESFLGLCSARKVVPHQFQVAVVRCQEFLIQSGDFPWRCRRVGERNKELIPGRCWKNGRDRDILSVAPTMERNTALISTGVKFRSFWSFFLNSRQRMRMGQHFSELYLSSPSCILPVIFLFWSIPGSSGLLPTLGKWQTTLSLQFSSFKEYTLFAKRHLNVLSLRCSPGFTVRYTDMLFFR